VIATLFNTRFGVKKWVTPAQVNPLRTKKPDPPLRVPLKSLRSFLTGQKNARGS
jgi:hypothetical protein